MFLGSCCWGIIVGKLGKDFASRKDVVGKS
jgi:hypothetical protein